MLQCNWCTYVLCYYYFLYNNFINVHAKYNITFIGEDIRETNIHTNYLFWFVRFIDYGIARNYEFWFQESCMFLRGNTVILNHFTKQSVYFRTSESVAQCLIVVSNKSNEQFV